MKQGVIPLSEGRQLVYGYKTTHRSRRWGPPEQYYITRYWWNRSDGNAYVIMGYHEEPRLSARAPSWGIYRVEEWPGHFYPEGNYTLLEGDLSLQTAWKRLPDIVGADPGHQHRYWTSTEGLQSYRTGTSSSLMGHCRSCSDWIFTKEVETRLANGTIEVVTLLVKKEGEAHGKDTE